MLSFVPTKMAFVLGVSICNATLHHIAQAKGKVNSGASGFVHSVAAAAKGLAGKNDEELSVVLIETDCRYLCHIVELISWSHLLIKTQDEMTIGIFKQP
jgi:hypothetical protein